MPASCVQQSLCFTIRPVEKKDLDGDVRAGAKGRCAVRVRGLFVPPVVPSVEVSGVSGEQQLEKLELSLQVDEVMGDQPLAVEPRRVGLGIVLQSGLGLDKR